jgi:hypothetical protein
MTREERSTYWQNLVDEQTDSDLTGAAFCREHNLNPQRFYQWRRRFKGTEPGNMSTGFFQLVPCSTHAHSGIRISLGDGLHIEIDRGFDPFTLRAVVEAIGKRKPCLP